MHVEQRTKSLLFALPLALFIFSSGCSHELKYASLEDCLLENIKGSETEAAALIIAQACNAKFPPSEEELAAEHASAADAAAAADKASKEAKALLAPLIEEHQEAGDAAQAAADEAIAAAEAAAAMYSGE